LNKSQGGTAQLNARQFEINKKITGLWWAVHLAGYGLPVVITWF
jgi:hypothetical protein